jgi:hypothetical protein
MAGRRRCRGWRVAEPAPDISPSGNQGCARLAVIAIGLLILVPSGLCVGIFGIGALVDGDPEFLFTALLIGGLPLAIGIGLVVLGRRMKR